MEDASGRGRGGLGEEEEEDGGVGELAAEGVEAVGEEGFDRVDGDAEFLGGLAVLAAPEDDGGDDEAGALREALDGLADGGHKLGGVGDGIVLGGLVGDDLGTGGETVVAKVVEAAVADDAEEVGGEGVGTETEVEAVGDEVVDGILYHVLGEGVVAEEGAGEKDEGFIVAGVEETGAAVGVAAESG